MTKLDVGSMNENYVTIKSVGTSSVSLPAAAHQDASPRQRKRLIATIEPIEAATRMRESSKLKAIVRTNAWPSAHEVRRKLWKVLTIGPDTLGDNLFEEYAKKLFENEEDEDLPINIASDLRVHNLLNHQGIHATQRVLYVIGETNPHIQEFSPLLYAIAATLLHYMTESECFDAIYHLIKSKVQYFLSPTSNQLKASVYVLKDLAFSHCKSAAASLERLCQDNDLTELCDEWVLWIFKYLPFDYLVSIVDCYLVEGYKVLFRVALGLLILYHKHSSRESDCGKPEVAIRRFCEGIEETVSLDKLLKVAFGIRKFTRREINSLLAKNEMRLRKHDSIVRNGSTARFPPSLPSNPSMLSLSAFGRKQTHPHRKLEKRVSCQSFKLDQKIHHNFMLENIESSILDHHQLQQLWSYLPDLQSVQDPELVFTTDTHGYSISRFYEHCEDRGPTLIIIKTLKGDTMGAYCSVDWNTRRRNVDMAANVSFFGTGESFVFRMNPDPYVYMWVGRTNPSKISTCSMFMAADKSFLIIGGGTGEAIYIDETLDHGRSARSDTFNNSPLVDEDDGTFQIQTLEAFSFS